MLKHVQRTNVSQLYPSYIYSVNQSKWFNSLSRLIMSVGKDILWTFKTHIITMAAWRGDASSSGSWIITPSAHIEQLIVELFFSTNNISYLNIREMFWKFSLLEIIRVINDGDIWTSHNPYCVNKWWIFLTSSLKLRGIREQYITAIFLHFNDVIKA